MNLKRIEFIYWKFVNVSGRIVGGGFLIVGAIMTIWTITKLFDPTSTIDVNGTPTSDIGYKLILTIVPAVVALMGWFMLRSKSYYPNRLKSLLEQDSGSE